MESEWSQGRVKDEVTRDPDPARDKRQIQFRAHGVLLIGACLQSTLGEQGSCGARVVGKLQEVSVSRGRPTS